MVVHVPTYPWLHVWNTDFNFEFFFYVDLLFYLNCLINKLQPIDGCQLWEAAFGVQAIISTELFEEFGHTLKSAHKFLHDTQVLWNLKQSTRFCLL